VEVLDPASTRISHTIYIIHESTTFYYVHEVKIEVTAPKYSITVLPECVVLIPKHLVGFLSVTRCYEAARV
jgi:hypothetical protein